MVCNCMTIPSTANNIISKALKLLDPKNKFNNYIKGYHKGLKIKEAKFEIKGDLYIFAVGKSASYEAEALNTRLKLLGIIPKKIIAYTKTNHSISTKDTNFIQIEGSHPYLSERNINNTNKFINYLESVKKSDSILFLLSGGASSLLEIPLEQIPVTKMIEIYKNLISSDRNINQINEIRKTLSQTKNGGLTKFIKTNNIFQFINCDIPNEDIYFVGSSPLLWKEIKLDKNITDFLSLHNIENIQAQKHEKVSLQSEFLNSGSLFIEELSNFIENSKIKLKSKPKVLDMSFEDYKSHVELPEKDQIVLSGGELTISLPKNHGKGGRNTHFVLSMACIIYKDPANKDIQILSLGTDGTDGPTDSAGAYINYELYKNLDPIIYLKQFNSYEYFDRIGTLIKTGPTKSNVMDLRCIWRE